MKACSTFCYPAIEWDSDDAGILLKKDSGWFRELLQRVPNLTFRREDLQEDWGVLFYAGYLNSPFWIGLSFHDTDWWCVHFHHDGLISRFKPSSRQALKQLLIDFHKVLSDDEECEEIRWHEGNVPPSGTKWDPTPN